MPPISAGSLSVVQREIRGFVQAILRFAVIGAFGDPDAAGRRDICAIVRNRDGKTPNDSAANRLDSGRTVALGKQNREFVATEPRQAIRFSCDRPEARTCFDQQRITGIMAQCIIDVLEPVEVDQQQGETSALTPNAGERLPKILIEHAPIR